MRLKSVTVMGFMLHDNDQFQIEYDIRIKINPLNEQNA